MEIRKFRKIYDLELIPASTESIINGILVWDPIIGKPKLDHPGMPNHILNAFVDAEFITMAEYGRMYTNFKKLSFKMLS